ncbi:PAS domain-containing protein [Sphingomonas sp. LR60]|uniref:PAS domain-containing protein n=1 Tax=Sphingomonas sp. LR60 TaxID=3050233 RepID=UPI002FE1D57B
MTGGDTGSLIAARDWAGTQIGPTCDWPEPLRTSLLTCLRAPTVGAVLWGPDHLLLYNDAYADVLADRHPTALGRPLLEVFAEVANVLGPQLEEAYRSGRGFLTVDQTLSLHRAGMSEETQWTYSFAPIRGADGHVAGLSNSAIETSARARGDRARDAAERRMTAATSASGLSADFRALFEASPTPLVVVAPPDWTIVAANDARLQVTGITREAQIGRRLFDLFPTTLEIRRRMASVI